MRFLQSVLLQLKPQGINSAMLWAFDSLKSYRGCLPMPPACPAGYNGSLSELLHGCVVHPAVKLTWHMDYHDYIWTVNCTSSRQWDEVLPEIEAALSAPDITTGFGLSAEASNLLRWVKAQPKNKLLLGCTPIVEDAIRKYELRLGAQWPSDNLAALIEVLCDEISTRTPFILKRIPWMDYSREHSRIRITEDSCSENAVIAVITRWLDAQGVSRTSSEIQQALERLRNAGLD